MRQYWYGTGHGQAGDAGTAYRQLPDGSWQRQRRGYTTPLPGGGYGWTVSPWEPCPLEDVPAELR